MESIISTNFRPIYLQENQGLGNALRLALKEASHSLVARMDSDDISFPYRFEQQLECFDSNPELDIVGGSITEFMDRPDNITGVRSVYENDTDIKRDMKKRCAMNHVAVMYKKEAVNSAGGYRDWPWNEDYYLWIRMLRKKCTFHNVPYPLVNVRIGNSMSERRGGMPYFKSEAGIQRYMLNHRIISPFRFLYNVALRFGGEVVLSSKVRTMLFKSLRDTYKGELPTVKTNHDNTVKNKFSVAMSVYGKDNPEWFDTALESIIVNQTVKPDEVVLVVDGPISNELQQVIDKYAKICSGGATRLKIKYLSKNMGLGNALRTAVEECNYDLIARMDSDDISLPTRFEEQLLYFVKYPTVDIVGGDIAEFIGKEENIVGKRIVPTTNEEIRDYMKKRCAFNHMSVMYKKDAVQSAGGYKDWFWNEDYYLWIRMWLNGSVFANTGTVLVNVRVGEEMYKRRGGDKYFASEKQLQDYMLKHKMIDRRTYLSNVAKRFIIQKAMPNSLRGWVFRTFARSKDE